MRPTLPAARGSSQLAAIAESLVTDAGNRRVTCLLHVISDGTRVRHAQSITLSILRAFISCAATVQTAVLALGTRHSVLCFSHDAGTAVRVRTYGLYGYDNKEFFHCRINTQTVP